MKKKFTLITGFTICILAAIQTVVAQTNTFPATGAAGIGTLAPNTSSLLDITSTSKGILIPRMTQAQRNAIVGPATGLMIYQTTNTPGFYYYSGTAWTAISSKGANTALSNLKTPTAVNQSLLPAITNSIDLGSSSLMWRNAYLSGDALIHGITIGLGSGSLPYNLAIGFGALHANTTGNYNIANGYQALSLNTTGTYNTASGYQALGNNATGNSNTGHGSWTLYNNTTGDLNTAVGYAPLFSNTTGAANTANGYEALYFTTTGSGNTANGYNALFLNTSGHSNVAMGAGSLYSNTTQSNLVAVGDSALRSNTTGGLNTAVGSKSLYSNTTGIGNTANGFQALYSNTTGNDNTANGRQALLYNTGYDNTANGAVALYNNTTGNFNTVNGAWSLFSNLTGNYNTAIGYYALTNNSSGSNNTTLGALSDVSLNNLTNATAIGYNAIVDASNKVRIGNSSVTVVESNAGFWTTSDGRFKNNIKDDVKGLEFIKLLRPVSYNFDTRRFEEFLMQNYPDSIKATRIESMKQSFEKSSSVRQTGFVAQEVFEAARKSGYNFNGIHAPENPIDNWSLSYEKLVVPLVKAVQELSKQNDDLKKNYETRINELQKQIEELRTLVAGGNSLQAANSQQVSLSSTFKTGASSLSQNIPNPFNERTIINYILPQQYSSAKIIIVDKSGKVLKQVNLHAGTQSLSGHDKGSLQIDATTMAAGAYHYSLYVDGKLIDSKQMEHIK